MNKVEAENYIYRSYLDAQKYHRFEDADRNKRDPALTRDYIRSISKTPCVVVTGSKGKGSVSCMIARIMQNYMATGMMTSPHISDFCERFRVNGQMIEEEDFIKHTELLRSVFDPIMQTLSPGSFISPMGIQAALAINYFNEKNTLFNVFECGKGAKYDDVNNIPHEYAVINTIFTEHVRELGPELEDIARDKVHVITGEQTCVWVGKQEEKVLKIILDRAESLNVPAKVYGRDFFCENIRYTKAGMRFDAVISGMPYRDITIPLLGEHQAYNCAIAMALCKDLLESFEPDKVAETLRGVSWPGRMEIISSEPFILLDACINSASAENIKKVLRYLKTDKAAVIVGIPEDKDYKGVVRKMLDISNVIILTKSRNPHYVFSEDQKVQLEKEGIKTLWADSLPNAVSTAKDFRSPIVILGSTSIVSEVKELFK